MVFLLLVRLVSGVIAPAGEFVSHGDLR